MDSYYISSAVIKRSNVSSTPIIYLYWRTTMYIYFAHRSLVVTLHLMHRLITSLRVYIYCIESALEVDRLNVNSRNRARYPTRIKEQLAKTDLRSMQNCVHECYSSRNVFWLYIYIYT